MNIMSPSWAVVGQIWVLTVTYKRQVFLVRNPRDVIPTEGMCKIQLVTSSSLWGNREAKGTGLKVKFVLSSVLWILFSVPVVRTLLLMPMILLQANLFACKKSKIWAFSQFLTKSFTTNTSLEMDILGQVLSEKHTSPVIFPKSSIQGKIQLHKIWVF